MTLGLHKFSIEKFKFRPKRLHNSGFMINFAAI